MAELDEDWHLARATGSFEGTRSSISFILHQRSEQGAVITARLRRSAKNLGESTGHWTLEGVEVEAHPRHQVTSAIPRRSPRALSAGSWTRASRAATYLSSLDDVALCADVPLEAPAELDARRLAAVLNRTRADYRLVAPTWKPARDRLRLLLPLSGADDVPQSILALRLEGEGDGVQYICSECRTLRETWACVRIVCPKRSVWLAAARQT